MRLSRWRAACSTSAFLCELKEQHELEETEFLVDAMGYWTALVRTDLGGWVEYRYRNLVKNWFQTLQMRVKRFHTVWNGELAIVSRWLASFAHYYNVQRSNHTPDDRTPAR